MRYVRQEDAHKVKKDHCGNIATSGSVKGMQKLFGWKPGEQVRIGGFIYNVGAQEVERLRGLGILKGETR